MCAYRIDVDVSLCSGFGACIEQAPGAFELKPPALVSVRTAQSEDPAVVEAALACPMGAIAVLDTASGEQVV